MDMETIKTLAYVLTPTFTALAAAARFYLSRMDAQREAERLREKEKDEEFAIERQKRDAVYESIIEDLKKRNAQLEERLYERQSNN